mmetsp:Transcript_59253/g.176067  ORF Transcript_59253/g.176067 Transcript_59253/m.176067 type:complete len:469 (-) Transcript_59253:173-1579(-)|eukprot:CAMPEP_0113557656 /NCGR_PEP_ID=MMETSP0015_2-20120614/17911_1 /TAXON_ID=2838 /ORGANISM="Odontella" /LENGTH=468 /DNA_ID=CAMNT_0000459103 /DNA_START=123 /DNA_END=1529 /DNA_ORIENTATION=+ /assembly_acc=CAM_ASM_000160
MNICSADARKGLICSLLVSLILCANHFCRDAPGTVEEQLARDPYLKVSPSRYALLTAVYFTPSTIVPLALGLLSNVCGVSSVVIFHVCAWLGVAGNVISGFGAAKGSFALLLTGRSVAGTVYEAVDMMPLGFVPQMLPGDLWPILSGILNGVLRLGSVAAFIILPVIYQHEGGEDGSGTRGVFVSVALVGSTMGPLATVVWMLVSGRACVIKDSHLDFDTREVSLATEIETATSFDRSASLQKEKETKEQCGLVATLKSIPRTFWTYTIAGTAMYASVIPFWFYGSGFLQRSRGFSLQAADRMLIFPEGMICLLSSPTGLLIHYFKLDYFGQQRAMGVATVCIALSYILLASGAPATLGVVVLGSSYAVSNQLFWSAFPDACPSELASLGAGITACFINVGATVIPPMIGAIHESLARDVADVAMLLLLSSFSLVSFCIAMSNSKQQAEGYEPVSEVVLDSGSCRLVE